MNSTDAGQWSQLFRGPNFRNAQGEAWGVCCSPTAGGIYRIIALQSDGDFKPATIERLLGSDASGTLYVGCASATLCGRLGDVTRTLISGKNQNHTAAFRLIETGPVAERFPLRRLAITWQYDDDPAKAEEKYLAHYKLVFGETPPLNEQ